MRTFLFILALIAIIAAALFIKKKMQQSPDDEFSSEQRSPSRWDSILPGKWHIYQTDSKNGRDEWLEKNSDLEISGNHEFLLNVTEIYHAMSFNGRIMPMATIGGGAKGKWYAHNNGSFMLKANECSFNIDHDSFLDHMSLGCDSLRHGLAYGAISSLDFKSEIEVINRDTIMITGRQYSRDYDIYCLFTRDGQQ